MTNPAPDDASPRTGFAWSGSVSDDAPSPRMAPDAASPNTVPDDAAWSATSVATVSALAAVSAIVAEEADIDPADVGPTLGLQTDLRLDVLSIWTIVTLVEDRLRVAIPDAVVPALRTVADMAAYVEASLTPPTSDPEQSNSAERSGP